MSRDDWVAIIKERNKYKGYWLSASRDYPTLKSIKGTKAHFEANTIEEAILKAQEIRAEYGYNFVNLKKKK